MTLTLLFCVLAVPVLVWLAGLVKRFKKPSPFTYNADLYRPLSHVRTVHREDETP